MATQPNLGYGQQSETTIDNANIFMRSQPWYQSFMKSIGQDPGHPTLSESQSQQVKRLAQANGFVVDEGNMEVDDHGNFNPIGHKLRNTLIVGGLAGAAILTAGLATPLFGAGGSAAGAAGAAGGVEAGATAGLGAAALPGAGTALGVGATAGGGGGLWSTIGSAAAKLLPGAGGSGGGSTWSQLAGMAGSAIGKAGTAAGNNRLNQEQLALQANGQNISGNTAAENALEGRSTQEMKERAAALKDVSRANYVKNPSVSQFNTHAPQKYSDEFMSSLTALEQQGLARLKANPTYSTNAMPALPGYKPIDPANVQGATNTSPGLWSQINEFAGPALSTYGAASLDAAARARKARNAADDANFGG